MNGYPASGLPVLKDDANNLCLGTLYSKPLKTAGLALDVVGNARITGSITGIVVVSAAGLLSVANINTNNVNATSVTLATGNISVSTGTIFSSFIGSNISRPTKTWLTDLDVTNMPTVNGYSLLGIIQSTPYSKLLVKNNLDNTVAITPVTKRATGQTAANASVATLTVGAADSSYMVSANILVTTSGSEAFTATVTYTDEGNTVRTFTLGFETISGALSGNISFANGAVPYLGAPVHIRAKAATAITIKTSAVGTYTGCTYNIEGVITQIA